MLLLTHRPPDPPESPVEAHAAPAKPPLPRGEATGNDAATIRLIHPRCRRRARRQRHHPRDPSLPSTLARAVETSLARYVARTTARARPHISAAVAGNAGAAEVAQRNCQGH